MNNLRYNNKTPTKYYYGATEIPSIYYGSTQVYSQGPSIPVFTRVGDGLGYGTIWIKVKGDYAYALGGAYSSSNYVKTIKRYDLKTNTWETLSITLPANNYGVKPTLYTDGNFYVIGQWPSYNQIWKFDPDTPSITTIGTFNCATGDGIVYNGLIYRFGGFVKYNDVSNVYTYNPETNTVQDTGMRLSSANQQASPVLVGNKAYVAVSKVLNIFNLDTNTREKTITFNASGHCFVTKHGNKLLFYSGDGSIYLFDIETEAITQQNEVIPGSAESIFTYKDTDYICYKDAMYTYHL